MNGFMYETLSEQWSRLIIFVVKDKKSVYSSDHSKYQATTTKQD